MPNTDELLARVPIFSAVSKRDLNKLAKQAHERSFPAGTLLTEQSEFGSIFTVIAEGRAKVIVDGKDVRTLGPGSFFGEMALIDSNDRSATVVAETDVSCVILTHWAFRPFAMEHPEVAWSLLELMVRRVREAEQRNG